MTSIITVTIKCTQTISEEKALVARKVSNDQRLLVLIRLESYCLYKFISMNTINRVLKYYIKLILT